MSRTKVENKRILVISHDASRTGAPLLLFHLLSLLKRKSEYDIAVVFNRGGELEEMFSKLYPVVVLRLGTSILAGPTSWISKIIDYLRYLKRKKSFFKTCGCPDLIFSNTITNGRLLKDMRKRWKVPVITYVHELESIIKEFDLHGDSSFSMQNTDLFLYPSVAVANNLRNNHNIQNLSLLRYYFPFAASAPGADKMKLRQKMAQEYKLDPKAFWIAGMGTVTKRKGADIFIEVAIRLNVEDPNIHLIWIGGFPDVQMKADLEEKIQCQKLRNITFTGPVPYDLHTLKPFDLFLLTSREDPYPLVVIEAAYNKVPTLCFEKSGGIPEFVNKDSGWIAEELSVDKMVESILKIVKDSDQIKRKGESAYEKALRWHADEEAVLNAFQEIIQNVKRTK